MRSTNSNQMNERKMGITNHSVEPADLKNKRPRSVFKFLGTAALPGFFTDTLEDEEEGAAAFGFSPVDLTCDDIVERKGCREKEERIKQSKKGRGENAYVMMRKRVEEGEEMRASNYRLDFVKRGCEL